MPAKGWHPIKVTVRLPECMVKCLASAYGETPSGAIRRFVFDVLSGRVERVVLPDSCMECIGGGRNEA